MIVGVLRVELALLEAQTLKDKRRIIKGVKDRLHHRFNVSVAEVGFGDSPKRCRLGIAAVANESRFVHSMLDKMIDTLRHVAGLTLIDYKRELL